MIVEHNLIQDNEEDEDGVERIDLEALKKLDQTQRQINPLKPYKEEAVDKPSSTNSFMSWLNCCRGENDTQ